MSRTLALSLAIMSWLASSRVSAQSYFSDYAALGPRVTYNFGEGGGWKFGFEVSYFPKIRTDAKYPYGLTFDLMFPSSSAISMHVGVETPAGIGLDIGPTFTYINGTIYPAFTMIAFAGLILYPAFEHTIYFSPFVRNYTSLGAYLKWPLGRGISERYFNFQ